jgi:hypothetical protein
MAEIVVTRNGGELTLSHQQRELQAGDWIVWSFVGLNLHELPYIHFHPTELPEDRRFGPFQYLEPSNSENSPGPQLRGIGNSGHIGTYPYTAFILTEQGVAAQSDGLSSIVNLSSQVDTSPVATILCHNDTITIAPNPLKVELGRPALWYITGVPEGHFVSFRFENFPDEMIGPFSSFGYSRGIGEPYLAIGTNYGGPHDGPPTGQVHYRVALRRPDGSILHHEDPVIEPPGWPPSPS